MTGQEHNDNGLYCTLTRIQVYGSSMHQVMRDISMDLIKQPSQNPSEKESATDGKVCDVQIGEDRWKQQNIMDSLAGIDTQLTELSKKGDESNPLLFLYGKNINKKAKEEGNYDE